jgi:hypothetical protein
MAASLDDIFTTAKNIVTAINGLNTSFQRSLGSVTTATVTVDTLVVTGNGRLVNVCVVDGGSADGAIYNINSVTGGTDANTLFTIPQTADIYPLGQIFNSGLVIAPGTGQKINVTYFLG